MSMFVLVLFTHHITSFTRTSNLVFYYNFNNKYTLYCSIWRWESSRCVYTFIMKIMFTKPIIVGISTNIMVLYELPQQTERYSTSPDGFEGKSTIIWRRQGENGAGVAAHTSRGRGREALIFLALFWSLVCRRSQSFHRRTADTHNGRQRRNHATRSRGPRRLR